MDSLEDIDQFQLLENKIDTMIEFITALKKEKESLSEKIKMQEEKLAYLNVEIEDLKTVRDKAKQKIVGLLQKIEQVET
ncbi:MAG: cell division protein ZapB [Deltaproteobacteria bacterium]|nr:cell division protein ZapB [Deltaproteobacteria bacterium]